MKTGLALRMRAVFGTTSLTAENKQGTTVHDDVKDKHPALLHSDAMKVDVTGGWPAFRIQKQISAAQIAEAPLKKSALDRRLRSTLRSKLKIKFKLLKTGPLLLPVGSRCFTSGECNDRNRSP